MYFQINSFKRNKNRQMDSEQKKINNPYSFLGSLLFLPLRDRISYLKIKWLWYFFIQYI